MAYGNVGKYENMELNDCALHTANKALLTVYTRYWYYGYGHGHGVCIAFGQCHLFLFLWTFGLLYWLAFGPPTDGRTTVIFPRGSVLVYAVVAIMKMEMSMISYVWIWTAALCQMQYNMVCVWLFNRYYSLCYMWMVLRERAKFPEVNMSMILLLVLCWLSVSFRGLYDLILMWLSNER